jgi:hypothetical protein
LKVDVLLAKTSMNGLKCGSFWSCGSFSDSTVLGRVSEVGGFCEMFLAWDEAT